MDLTGQREGSVTLSYHGMFNTQSISGHATNCMCFSDL